jgi:hypothetical protein
MKFKHASTVQGTPLNHVGPRQAFIGSDQGFTPGVPDDLRGTTVKDQFRDSGIDTRPDPRSGTPYNSRAGTPDEYRRTAEGTGRYGIVLGAGGIDHNNPNANGVVLDGMKKDLASPKPAPLLDSPVPNAAPNVDSASTARVVRSRLGSNVAPAAARDNLLDLDGVMSR